MHRAGHFEIGSTKGRSRGDHNIGLEQPGVGRRLELDRVRPSREDDGGGIDMAGAAVDFSLGVHHSD